MVVSIVMTDKLTEQQKVDAFDDKEITIKGTLSSLHFQDNAISEAFRDSEFLQNFISMGLIDADALMESGYLKKRLD